jgi:hypothetical protein
MGVGHLASLTRNQVRFLNVDGQPVGEQQAMPTPTKDAPSDYSPSPSIPLTLT